MFQNLDHLFRVHACLMCAWEANDKFVTIIVNKRILGLFKHLGLSLSIFTGKDG